MLHACIYCLIILQNMLIIIGIYEFIKKKKKKHLQSYHAMTFLLSTSGYTLYLYLYLYIYIICNRCNIWFSHRPRSDVRALIENGFRSNHLCIEEMLWTWDREVWLALTVFPVHLENTNEHYRFLSFVPISELHPNVLRLFLSFSRYLWLAPMFWPDISQALDPCVIL